MSREFQRPINVQRLSMSLGKINPFSFGGGKKNGGLSDEAANILKDIFSIDYMGSAEFEFGAFAEALDALNRNKDIVRGTLSFSAPFMKHDSIEKLNLGNTKTIYYACHKDIQSDVAVWLEKVANEPEVFLREMLYFHESLIGTRQNIGWVELDNPFMFFIDEEIFLKICKELEIQ